MVIYVTFPAKMLYNCTMKTTDKNNNDKQLLALIKGCGFTISEFAIQMGWNSRQKVYRVCSRPTDIKFCEVAKIAQILKIDVSKIEEIITG